MKQKYTCTYVLKPETRDSPAVYCGKKVGFKIVKDDDKNNIRKYNSLCDDHLREVSNQSDEDNIDWGD